MVEPLLHFILPYTSLKTAGVHWRRAFLASTIALTPDLDVLFHIHRSLSHSILILALIALPILTLTHKNRNLRNLTILCAIGVISHLTLDLFNGYTPLLWPLLNESLWITTSLDIQLTTPPTPIATAQLLTTPTAFTPFESLQAPLITATGLSITIILLTPTLLTALKRNHRPIRISELAGK